MNERMQVTELMRGLAARILRSRQVLAQASARCRDLSDRAHALGQPLNVPDPSMPDARNAVAHQTWRKRQREKINRDLALARVAEAMATRDLQELQAREEALKTVLDAFERTEITARRKAEQARLLDHILRRQTS